MRQSFEIKIAEPQGYYKNIMHNKYCIIDSKIIINGSYNWTKKANYNNETITINESKELAEKFLKNFMNIWKEN